MAQQEATDQGETRYNTTDKRKIHMRQLRTESDKTKQVQQMQLYKIKTKQKQRKQKHTY